MLRLRLPIARGDLRRRESAARQAVHDPLAEYRDVGGALAHILQDLGYPIDDLQRMWQDKNKIEKGGDRRGSHPRGIPFPK